ncbi:MAG: tetratricopeptide repeat protein, partial [Planctomycetota bacterium]
MVRTLAFYLLLSLVLPGCATSPAPVSRPVASRVEPLPVTEPKTAADYLALGDFFLARDGQEGRALASYRKALTFEPETKVASRVYCGMGEVYRRARDYRNAVASFNSAVKADEGNPRA